MTQDEDRRHDFSDALVSEGGILTKWHGSHDHDGLIHEIAALEAENKLTLKAPNDPFGNIACLELNPSVLQTADLATEAPLMAHV